MGPDRANDAEMKAVNDLLETLAKDGVAQYRRGVIHGAMGALLCVSVGLCWSIVADYHRKATEERKKTTDNKKVSPK